MNGITSIKSLTYDLPVEYKNLKIYPAKMIDYLEFHTYVSCLLIDKDSVPDINVISMTYLDYLYYTQNNLNEPYLYFLDNLLKMVLHTPEDVDENFIQYKKRENKAVLLIGNEEYSASDFNKIKDIICEQNCIEQVDSSIDIEVRKAMEEARELRMKMNKNKMCTLEEQLICVLISTNLDLPSIYNLTIRKFVKILKRIDHKLHYEIYMNAAMSGFAEFKDKSVLRHWMSDFEEKDKFADTKMGLQSVSNKMNGIK